jgi:uncharacterized repeat protein (TIGR03803 family)
MRLVSRTTRISISASCAFAVTLMVGFTASAPWAHGQTFTVLHSFKGGTDGESPVGGLVRDAAGNLYGTTEYGGGGTCFTGDGCGTVFKVDTTGKETVLHSFTGGADGAFPLAGLILDAAGKLYGTTEYGGNLACNSGVGCGTVFKMDPTGKETVLYSFTRGVDGAGKPGTGVVRDAAGNLYGTTAEGGPFSSGTVFKVDTTGKETVLYYFTGGWGGTDGFLPSGALIRDAAGNLYGTTQLGGNYSFGTVFKVDSTRKETVLYRFRGGSNGDEPVGGVIMDKAGNLYGATQGGGTSYNGTVFKLNPVGNKTVLYNFTGGSDGTLPVAGVIADEAGNLYGATAYGGSVNCSGDGCGTVFKLDKTGKETVLYSFTDGADGALPAASLVRDAAGNLYGTAIFSGDSGSLCTIVGGCGVVFKITP